MKFFINRSAITKLQSAIIVAIIIVAAIGGGTFYVQFSGPAPTTRAITTPSTATKLPDLTVGFKDEPGSLDPANAYMSWEMFVCHSVYELLVYYDARWPEKILPWVAESWVISSDGKSYTFTLKKGIKFHSGNEVNAAAVVYSFKRFLTLNRGPGWILNGFMDAKDPNVAVEKDKYTVELRLKDPYSPALLIFAHYPPIMDPAVVEAHGGMLSKEAETYFGENSGGAGSGPFTIDHWARGKEIVMKRWPNYWGGPLDLKPRFENVICKIVAEPANQFMMLKTGDLSIGGGVMGSLTMDQQLALKSASDIVTETNPTPSMFVISMSTSHKDSPFRNLKVRQAIKAAVNSTRIAAVFKGLAFEAGGAVPKGVLGYDPSLVGYIRYDTARAKQLLKEAGYENGFATDFLISKGFWSGVSREDLALLVSEDLAKIGIAVTVRAVPYAEWRNELAGGTYKGLFGAFWFSDYPDPENNAVAFSSTGGLMALRAGFNETISPAFAETTRMNRQATVTVDSAERARLYKEIQKIDLDTGPTVYVLQASTVNVYQKYIRGFVFNPICDTYPIFLWKE